MDNSLRADHDCGCDFRTLVSNVLDTSTAAIIMFPAIVDGIVQYCTDHLAQPSRRAATAAAVICVIH